jgi:hypothetical protein
VRSNYVAGSVARIFLGRTWRAARHSGESRNPGVEEWIPGATCGLARNDEEENPLRILCAVYLVSLVVPSSFFSFYFATSNSPPWKGMLFKQKDSRFADLLGKNKYKEYMMIGMFFARKSLSFLS